MPKHGVIQFDENLDEVKRYPTIKEAAVAIDGFPSNIGRCCKHLQTTHRSFYWRYDDDPIGISDVAYTKRTGKKLYYAKSELKPIKNLPTQLRHNIDMLNNALGNTYHFKLFSGRKSEMLVQAINREDIWHAERNYSPLDKLWHISCKRLPPKVKICYKACNSFLEVDNV